MNQHAILLNHLRRYGRTKCADLEHCCDVRSVTTRMTEMIRKGYPIEKSREYEQNSRGKPRRVTYYAIKADSPQSELFPQVEDTTPTSPSPAPPPDPQG